MTWATCNEPNKCIFNRLSPSSFLSLSCSAEKLSQFASFTCSRPERAVPICIYSKTPQLISLSPQFGNSLWVSSSFVFLFFDDYLNSNAGPAKSKSANHKNHFMLPAAPVESETFCFLHFSYLFFLSDNKSNKQSQQLCEWLCVCLCVCMVS